MLSTNEVRSHGNATRAGRMTAVMRAVASAREGPRVLRIGLVKDGQIVEERIVKTRATVSIGPGEDATLTCAAMAHTHRLFESSGGTYFLNLLPTMRGKIAQEDALYPIESLALHTPRVQLSEATRGRIVLGDTTLIFQFVDCPIAPAKPRLPLAVKQGLFEASDWKLTIIVALSFLAHFGFIGALYSDWSDPLVDEARTVQALVDMGPAIVPPPVEAAPETIATDEKKDPIPTPVANNDTSKHTTTDPNENRRRPAVDNTASLVDQAERMRISMTMSFSRDTAVQKTFDRELPAFNLSHPDANVTTDRDLTIHGDGPVAFNKNHVDLSTFVNARAESKDHVTPANPSKDPAPSYAVDTSVTTFLTPVPSAERTIAQLRPAFRRCYEQGLQVSAGMAGDLTMRIKIRPNGEVESASAVSNNGLSPEVAACIAKKVRLAQFEAPNGSGSSIDVPVKFVKQH